MWSDDDIYDDEDEYGLPEQPPEVDTEWWATWPPEAQVAYSILWQQHASGHEFPHAVHNAACKFLEAFLTPLS